MAKFIYYINPRSKEYLRSLAPDGYNYIGYWDKLYHYQKETMQGYVVVSENAEGLTKENLQFMATKGYTRIKA